MMGGLCSKLKRFSVLAFDCGVTFKKFSSSPVVLFGKNKLPSHLAALLS